MRSRVFVMVTVVSLVLSIWTLAGAQTPTGGGDEELQRFQGSWVLISAEMDGKKVEDTEVKKSRIKYVGRKIEIFTPHQHKETIVASIVELDLTKNPKEMQWIRTVGPKTGTTMIAIYEFEGPDQYKICFDPAGLAVPKEFRTKEGSGHIWHTWKREKQ